MRHDIHQLPGLLLSHRPGHLLYGDEKEPLQDLRGTRDTFFVDPIPQALTLTSIVIGACTTAMTLSLIIMLYKQYGTLESDQIRRLRG